MGPPDGGVVMSDGNSDTRQQPGLSPWARPATGEMRAGLTPYEAAVQLRDWVLLGNGYMRSRKIRFRRAAAVTKMTGLAMSAAATIILGVQNLTFWAGLGFSLVALTTVLNSIEPFFNWRSRWVFAEEAQHQLYQLQDDLERLVATKEPAALRHTDVEEVYRRYCEVWRRFGAQWMEERRRGGGPG
jgi:hypothetical protein